MTEPEELTLTQVGAIPLLSGMLESDQERRRFTILKRKRSSKASEPSITPIQEPAGFWTAAPNNVWRDNARGAKRNTCLEPLVGADSTLVDIAVLYS